MVNIRYAALLVPLAVITGIVSNFSCAEEPKKPRIDVQPDEMISPALRWLAAQQNKDGSWTSGDGKLAASPTKTTGVALLAYLSAGQSHVEGEYKNPVHAGLSYLIKQMKADEDRGDLRGPRGDMTSHGIAALALCEAYAMTHDKELLKPAQMGINYIAAQQDEKSGGWQSDPMARASVVTTTWQLLALKSAHMAYLQVSKNTVLGAMKFLDDVQLQDGSAYPNIVGKRDHRASAAGLLCRMMLGWKRTNPQIVKGLAAVGKDGPKPHDVTANYFTHQLHYHVAGETWPPWRNAIVEQLHDSQAANGENAGSWSDAADVNFARGGAIQQTALSVIILRTFLRGRDLLRDQGEEDEFPL